MQCFFVQIIFQVYARESVTWLMLITPVILQKIVSKHAKVKILGEVNFRRIQIQKALGKSETLSVAVLLCSNTWQIVQSCI